MAIPSPYHRSSPFQPGIRTAQLHATSAQSAFPYNSPSEGFCQTGKLYAKLIEITSGFYIITLEKVLCLRRFFQLLIYANER